MLCDIYKTYPNLIQKYPYHMTIQQHVSRFLQLYQKFRPAMGSIARSSSQSDPVIALMGFLEYMYNGQMYPVNIAIYLDYPYPVKQPRVLVIPDNNSINPGAQYMNARGIVRDIPWEPTFDICYKVQNQLLSQFPVDPPLIIIKKRQPGQFVPASQAQLHNAAPPTSGPNTSGFRFSADLQKFKERMVQQYREYKRAQEGLAQAEQNTALCLKQRNAEIAAELDGLIASSGGAADPCAVEVMADADIYEQIDAYKQKLGCMTVKKCEAESKRSAIDQLIKLMAKKEVGIDEVRKVFNNDETWDV